MNIVYILGNGFDKAQGLKTSYPEFYEYLDKQKGYSTLLQNVKLDIKEDTKLWADMEEAFGKFTSKIGTETDFQNLYFELSDYLREYLKSEDQKFIPSEELKNKFRSDFLSYGKYLGDLDKVRYENFVNACNAGAHINVISLNYTNTLEKLLSINYPNINVEKTFGSKTLHNIIHVHGSLDDAIIIGVDNESQIGNEAFRTNDNVKDLLVKIQSNHAMKFLKHEMCEKFISEANLIVLYGVSLGNTDLRWWNLIGKELRKRNNLAIIQHLFRPNTIKPTRRQLFAQIERTHQDELMQKMGFTQNEWSKKFADKLFFTVNSNIFKK